MSESLKLVAFCGSLRKASLNRLSLQAFVERLPAGATCDTIEIGDWPLYDADLQAKGFPDKVQAAQKAMLEADGIVLVSPEYNYGISVVLKLAIGWLAKGVIMQLRTLANFVNLLIEMGFTLARIDEWSSSAAQVAAHPDWVGPDERPTFLLISVYR
jgi:NAD(P)H-dependent FMN reductase